MSAGGALLLAERITAGYGKIDILHDVSVAARGGEIVSMKFCRR